MFDKKSYSVQIPLLSRRLLLKFATLSPLTWMPIYTEHTIANNNVEITKKIMSSILDILIPRDISPSATDVKLDSILLHVSSKIDNYPDLIKQGTSWFNITALKSFNQTYIELPTHLKTKIIEVAFEQANMTLPKVFIERIRDDAMTAYYQIEASWSGMLLEQPIQPWGYPQHDKPT
jgi:hypothetical protein